MASSSLNPSLRAAARRRIRSIWLLRFIAAAVIVAMWEAIAASAVLPKEIFPSILRILEALGAYLTSTVFYANLLTTSIEVGVAFAIGSLAGIAVGIVGGMSSYTGKVVDPYLHYLAPTPKIIFLPLFLLLFGVDMGSKIALGVVSAFFPVAVATLAGMRAIAPVLIRVGTSFRLSPLQMIRKIYLPALALSLSGGLGLGLGSAMTGVLLGECKMSSRGLGFLIIEAYRNFRIADMYALLALCFSLAVFLTSAIERTGRRFQRR
jgi:ABC-type nitrate/sulfonate/bicarbonate transport system permease component